MPTCLARYGMTRSAYAASRRAVLSTMPDLVDLPALPAWVLAHWLRSIRP